MATSNSTTTTNNNEEPIPNNQEEAEEEENSFLVNALDEMERQVESLRDNAKQIEEDRQSMLGSLNTMLQSQALQDVSEGKVVLCITPILPPCSGQGQKFAASCENPFGFLQQNFAGICGFSAIYIIHSVFQAHPTPLLIWNII